MLSAVGCDKWQFPFIHWSEAQLEEVMEEVSGARAVNGRAQLTYYLRAAHFSCCSLVVMQWCDYTLRPESPLQ